MTARNDAYLTARESAENLKLKNVAARWHECLQTFEAEWSPWYTPPAHPHDTSHTSHSSHSSSFHSPPGVAYYELSKHRDLYLRRMTMTQLPSPIDHNGAAYLEGKKQDQSRFTVGGGLDAAVTHLSIPHSSHSSASRVVLPFRKSAGVPDDSSGSGGNSGNGSGPNWGDDDEGAEDIVEENAASVGIAGGLANLLHWSEKRPQWTYIFHWAADERLLFESDAMQIKLDQVAAGTVVLTNKCLYFHARRYMDGVSAAQKPLKDEKWRLDRVVEAYGRRYLLQHCAIEMFFE
ncbi:hypothetical protein B484DRAFT_397675, partial [Ochromonadaceae sp. CCMP2298]